MFYRHPYGGSFESLEAQQAAKPLISSLESAISEEDSYQRYMEYLDADCITDPDWNASCERVNKMRELQTLLKWFVGE